MPIDKIGGSIDFGEGETVEVESRRLYEIFLLVVVLVLVLGFSGFLVYDDEDDDENEGSPAIPERALSRPCVGAPQGNGRTGADLTRGPQGE